MDRYKCGKNGNCDFKRLRGSLSNAHVAHVNTGGTDTGGLLNAQVDLLLVNLGVQDVSQILQVNTGDTDTG